MNFGIDEFIKNKNLRISLKGKRVALLAHPASLTKNFVHSLDALMQLKDIKITAAFGPQHGMRGEKQDNMMESEDYLDPFHKIPVFSLYGKVRRPTEEMLKTFDVLLVDLQDVGTRIYTFLTTLLYVLEAGAKYQKEIWVLDRPNPIGRPMEGMILLKGWESFVGAGPLPMRHGLTLAEAGLWFVKHFKLDVELKIVKIKNYSMDKSPGFGWPILNRSWVNPSPNAANINMTRCFPGTVMLEGTNLSEGRGTTRPLEVMGAPDITSIDILKKMEELNKKSKLNWLSGCRLRPCYFQPTFHKHSGKLVDAIQIHADDEFYKHNQFKPYRVMALYFKALRLLNPNYEIWRHFAYEYEHDRLAIDLINGGPFLREWVDDSQANLKDLEKVLLADEKKWKLERKEFLIY